MGDTAMTARPSISRALRALAGTALVGTLTFGASISAPAALAAPAAESCPGYGPGGCTGSGSAQESDQPDGTTELQGHAEGYQPGERVDGEVHSTAVSVGSWIADQVGAVSFTIVLPAGLAAGNHTLTLLGTVSGVSTVIPFTLPHATAGVTPCAASYSTGSRVVLAAAYIPAACISAAPPGQLPSGGQYPSGGQLPAAPGAAAVSGSAPASGAPASQLPFTGFNAATAASLGAMAVLAGGLLVLTSRRRRRSAWTPGR